jgi:beta-glucanase (GH16 family)
VAAAATLATVTSVVAAEPPPEIETGWREVWIDAFDKDGPPDPANWIHEIGFVRNREAQLYRRENVACRDGLLVIEARRERVANPAFDPAAPGSDWKRSREVAEYTSGSIKTKGLHAWRYGRFEMRGRIDIREGLWPAFWTVGAGTPESPARPWPRNGEIDIMEFFRGLLLANAAWGSEQPGRATWDDVKIPIGEVAERSGFESAEAWAGAFHLWRMDWDERSIRLYCDGHLLNEIDLSKTVNRSEDAANPLREPHLLILNLAIGGTSGGDPSATEFPARFEVDWVRVLEPVETKAE